ncbi:hypothetical protein JST97_15400 [bacterium]|nr:hypothetical protein [bacterium]
MRLLLIFILLNGLAWADPVDHLVHRLSESHGLWVNGLFPKLELPANASNQQLLAALASYARNPKVVSEREVVIPGGGERPYRALLLETDEGTRILLLQHQGPVGWWSRFYAPD